MDPFQMLVAIVAITAVAGVAKYGIDRRAAIAEHRQKAGVHNRELEERLERIERRLANLETIVLEREKHREFERAL